MPTRATIAVAAAARDDTTDKDETDTDSNLLESCIASFLEGSPATMTQLRAMPSRVLVQIAERAIRERLEFKAKVDLLEGMTPVLLKDEAVKDEGIKATFHDLRSGRDRRCLYSYTRWSEAIFRELQAHERDPEKACHESANAFFADAKLSLPSHVQFSRLLEERPEYKWKWHDLVHEMYKDVVVRYVSTSDEICPGDLVYIEVPYESRQYYGFGIVGLYPNGQKRVVHYTDGLNTLTHKERQLFSSLLDKNPKFFDDAESDMHEAVLGSDCRNDHMVADVLRDRLKKMV